MHTTRFNKAGDYFKLELGGFPFMLIKGSDGNIQAFHNVCRHRAYPIVRKDSGSSTVLGKSTLPPFVYSHISKAADTMAGHTILLEIFSKHRVSKTSPPLTNLPTGCLR
jgi:hypothetical protein